MIKKLKRYMITGVIVLMPTFVTVFILVAVFNFIDRILGDFLEIALRKYVGFYIPGLGFLLFAAVITLVGFLASRFLNHRIFPKIEEYFSSLPLINTLYPTVKQIILFILQKKELGFKKVVLVEYPSKGIWSIGFLTNEAFKRMSEVSSQDMVSVFMPTTPGPFSGYVIFVPKNEIRFPDISVNEALKILISGGAFKPE
jgi:uncharacterized membrane protein